jgi:B-box zinc finger
MSSDSFSLLSDESASVCCDFCLPEAPSTPVSTCKECLVYLCQKHKEAHLENRYTFEHSLQNYDELKNDETLEKKLTENHAARKHVKTCKIHSPQLANLVCLECEETVCQSCHFMDAHKGHKFRFVLDQLDSAKVNFDGVKTGMNADRHLFEGKVCEMNELVVNLESVRGDLIAKLDLEKKNLLEKIESDYQKAKYDIEIAVDKKKRDFEKISADLNETVTWYTNGLNTIDQGLKTADPFITVVEAFKVPHWKEEMVEKEKILKTIMPTASDDLTVSWAVPLKGKYLGLKIFSADLDKVVFVQNSGDPYLDFSRHTGLLGLITRKPLELSLYCGYCSLQKIENIYLPTGDKHLACPQFRYCKAHHPSNLILQLNGKTVPIEYK